MVKVFYIYLIMCYIRVILYLENQMAMEKCHLSINNNNTKAISTTEKQMVSVYSKTLKKSTHSKVNGQTLDHIKAY